MNVGRNPLQVSSLQPQSAMAKLLKRLVSVVLILVSVSVTQISSEKVVRATALTCAEGGTCVVGDIGPGGGIIFYVSRLNFTSTSSNCNTECKYLEVAPSGWNGGSDPSGNLSVGIPLVSSHSVTIGSIVYDDWFLPSIGQLNQLCRWHRNVLPLLDYLYTSVTYGKNSECPGATLPNTGVGASAAGILGGRYLSSSAASGNVWDQDQSLGYNFNVSDQHSRYIRPVRAFSPVLVVTYDSQEGSAVSAGSTTSGGVVASAPVEPTRAGYVFTGWFTATSGGTAITFPFTHSQTTSFTLYAQWAAAYVVSFNGNGSTVDPVPANLTKTHGVNLALSSNSGSLVKAGYTFGEWNTAANGSGDSYAAGAPYGVDVAVTLYAQWTANSLTVTYDSQGGSAVSTGSSVSGGSITSAPVVPTRAGYVFTGWFTATSGGTAITFPYTHSQTTSFTLYAQWSQASLYGLGSVSKIATITTTTNISNTFSVDTETSSVSLRYLANGLPADSVIDVYLVNDLSRARSLFAPAGGFVVSLVVAWLAADGSVPLMASGKPLSMTIANDTIKAGAKTYAIVGGEVTLLGTATVDGTVTISITQDPEIVVVNPVAVVSQPSATPATPATPASPATESRRSSRPVVAPVVAPVTEVRNVPSRVASLLPKVLGATSKIAAILNTVVGQLPPRPMVFAPKLSSNGTVERVVFKPVVLKAPPIDAPVAPMGAKVIPIGSMIEQSKETPVAPVSKVGAGESKATFGGKTIETALETSLDGAAVLSAGPATIALAGFTSEPASSNGGASTSSGLTASSSTPLEIATGSFIASTPVQVWLFSTPMLLAETSVDENGNFAAAINLPSSLPAGNHTLQIQGFVYTASGAAEVTANIGVSVAAASVGVKWTSTFPLYVASISPSVRALWTTFVSGQASPTLQCTITGIRPQRNSKANIRLFENRQIALTTLLKYNGCVSIETKTQISATKSSVENRTWKVEVQSKATAVAFRWVHDYKTYSSTITAKQKTQWVAKVEKYAGQKLSCAITGAEPLRNSSANTVIFNNRNESLKTYLLKNGCSTVQINSPMSKNIKIATRTKWKVEVSTSN